MKKIAVDLGARSYAIAIGAEPLSVLVDASGWKVHETDGLRYAVVIDEKVFDHHGPLLSSVFPEAPKWIVPSGERSKTLSEVGRLLEFLAESRLDRTSLLVAVGGGVVGDMAGFAAATYLRGIEYFQVPTTLLAMVDSSVGGKTGVNLNAGKNLAGAFLQPQGVATWLPFLSTLTRREFSAGMAEVIKYGLLADEDLFHLLEKSGPLDAGSATLESIITRCCEIKAEVIADDEKEQSAANGRALLNLGHTFGHAIEAVAGYGEYLHGEAIAIGMVLAARFSEITGFVEADVVARVRKILEMNRLPVRLARPLPEEELISAMARDKKVRAGHLRLVALDRIGAAKTVSAPDDVGLRELWREVQPD